MKKLLLSRKTFWRILRHIILFASMILLFTWVAYFRSENRESFFQVFLMVFTNALFFFGYAYITSYILIPFMLTHRRYLLFALLFILTGLSISWLKFSISDFLFYNAISPENMIISSSFDFSDILVNTKDMTFIVAVFALLKFTKDNYLTRSELRELEEKRLEAEIRVLEHHLDPHVIFNNFNNLYSISINRPDLLLSTVRKLKSILTYLFLEDKTSRVSLDKELKMIENFIGLEKLRFGNRLNIDYKVEGESEKLRIAPLLLYSFVENCFEHGAGLDTGNAWIKIKITINSNVLKFKAANSIPEYLFNARNDGYHGSLENNIRRLEILHPNSHRLTIREKRNEHVVELQIGLNG